VIEQGREVDADASWSRRGLEWLLGVAVAIGALDDAAVAMAVTL
jgi:hypothetical protein